MKFYNTFIVFVFFKIVLVPVCSQTRFHYTYNQEADGYFKYHSMPVTWHDAELSCQYEGAVLASPHPKKIRNALIEIMNSRNSSGAIFTGINALLSKVNYITLGGTPLYEISVSWMENEPDNYNNEEQCLIFTPEGLMADKKCDHTYPYICYNEKIADDVKRTDPCGTPSHGYEYSSVTHNCYKFHKEARTWPAASEICASENGYLAIINSDEEAEVIRQLLAKNPEDQIPGGSIGKDYAIIGFRDWTEKGNWTTIHGYTLAKAGYAKFAPNEPNNYGGYGEFCGAVYRSGLLNDIGCHYYRTFICEKSMNIFDKKSTEIQ